MSAYYCLAMTRLKLKSPLYLPQFFLCSEKVLRQVRASEGFIKGKQLATPSLSMWTATLWISEKASKEFYLSGEHGAVMNKLSKWSSEAISGHQKVNFDELPSWSDIKIRLHQIGHLTYLEDPSYNHINRIIAKPQITILSRYF